MMNGPLDSKSDQRGERELSLLGPRVGHADETQKIQRLYLATLSRHARGHEESAAENLLESDRDKLAGYQDLFWALLEFQRVHHQPLTTKSEARMTKEARSHEARN